MSNLDMTLDDMIKMNKPYRAGHRTSVQGPTRRFQNRFASRAAPYLFANVSFYYLVCSTDHVHLNFYAKFWNLTVWLRHRRLI